MGFADWIYSILAADDDDAFYYGDKPVEKFSWDNLRYLFRVISLTPATSPTNLHVILEALREMSELLIWGDQHQVGITRMTDSVPEPTFFDFFMEHQLAKYFLHLLQALTESRNGILIAKLLQVLIILFENVQRDTSIYFLLSNNYVNEIIVWGRILSEWDGTDDGMEEVLAYYATFLKTLALKLNKTTLAFFFNENMDNYPFALYTCALPLAFHQGENMVRIAVRTLSLNIYRLSDGRLRHFLIDDDRSTTLPYWERTLGVLGHLISEFNSTCFRADLSKASDMMDQIEDLLFYINDVLQVQFRQLTNLLIGLFDQRITRRLMTSLKQQKSVSDDEKYDADHLIERDVALFLLMRMLYIIQNVEFTSRLIETLFESPSETVDALLADINDSDASPLPFILMYSILHSSADTEVLFGVGLSNRTAVKRRNLLHSLTESSFDEDLDKLNENLQLKHSSEISEPRTPLDGPVLYHEATVQKILGWILGKVKSVSKLPPLLTFQSAVALLDGLTNKFTGTHMGWNVLMKNLCPEHADQLREFSKIVGDRAVSGFNGDLSLLPHHEIEKYRDEFGLEVTYDLARLIRREQYTSGSVMAPLNLVQVLLCDAAPDAVLSMLPEWSRNIWLKSPQWETDEFLWFVAVHLLVLK